MKYLKNDDHLLFKRLLIRNDITKVKGHDIYVGVADAIPDPVTYIKEMNAGQRSVVTLARNALGGIVNVHGPPGTRKTYVYGEIGRLFIVANKPNTSILAVLVSNTSTDALAARFYNIILEVGNLG